MLTWGVQILGNILYVKSKEIAVIKICKIAKEGGGGWRGGGVATKFTLVYGPLFSILQGRLQSWIVTIHEDNVPNNTVVNASKPINFGRYFEWMPKLQTLAETYQRQLKNKVTWPLKAGKQTKQGTQPLQGGMIKRVFEWSYSIYWCQIYAQRSK